MRRCGTKPICGGRDSVSTLLWKRGTAGGQKKKIGITDPARRNPFERRFRAVAAGLAVLDAPEGTLAIYSAAPGKLINEGSGTNSVFVTELMKEMRIPNVTA